MTETPIDAAFWDIAEPFLSAGAERSSMMGFPCLRIGGEFFASVDHRTGELIVKLPASRVDELIAQGSAKPFAPSGRRFKQWATIPHSAHHRWEALMGEARAFARQP